MLCVCAIVYPELIRNNRDFTLSFLSLCAHTTRAFLRLCIRLQLCLCGGPVDGVGPLCMRDRGVVLHEADRGRIDQRAVEDERQHQHRLEDEEETP